MATSVKGSHRGVEHPISEDMALIGSTAHELHTKSLPKNEHPYKAHQNGTSPGSGNDPEKLRLDKGSGMEAYGNDADC
jgi:hypothetical protein